MTTKADVDKARSLDSLERSCRTGYVQVEKLPEYASVMRILDLLLGFEAGMLMSGHKEDWFKQIFRSAQSILANLAEGIGRGGGMELLRFYRIARGSAYETKAWAQMGPGGLKETLVLAVDKVIVQLDESCLKALQVERQSLGRF